MSEGGWKFVFSIKAYDSGEVDIHGQCMEATNSNCKEIGIFSFNDLFFDFIGYQDSSIYKKIESYENNMLNYHFTSSNWSTSYTGYDFIVRILVKQQYRKTAQEVGFFGKNITIPFGTEPITPFDNTEYEQLKSANAALTEQNSLLSAEKDYLSSQLQEAKDEITILNADLTTYKAIAQALTEAANQKTEEIRLLKISQEELETKIKQLTNNPDNADFNNDGRITVADAVYFLVYLANKPSTMVEWIE